ncbi:MAG: DNA/RNA nuclease SfsA [Treponema sp.]|nr:DNA/RNA nuclease SfsA [Candidatus Treponema equifaecale]
MMRYENTITGKFIDRPNRFIAHVEIERKIETVHVKNTGRCKELLLPGSTVILEDFRNTRAGENRKTKFDLIAVYKKRNTDQLLINMDSQAPNKAAFEWLKKQDYTFIKPEYTFGQSRIDFYMERNDSQGNIEKWLLEIKGCTLEIDDVGYFPDAPTERGVKHLRELAAAAKNGYKCAIGFVIQMENISKVLPNVETHAEFGKALEEAMQAGVEVWYLQCKVKEDSLEVVKA